MKALLRWETIVAGSLLLAASCSPEEQEETPRTGKDPAEEQRLREERDRTVWADEVKAQRFEGVFVSLWDSVKSAPQKFAVLSEFPFSELTIGKAGAPETLDLDVTRTPYSDETEITLDPAGFQAALARLQRAGYELIESEWHHSRFIADADPPRSVIGTVLHVRKKGSTAGEPEDRYIVRTDLHVVWDTESGATPVPASIAAKNLRILHRRGVPPFVQRLKITRGPHPLSVAHPLILNDLDGDGLSEIIIPRWNSVYRNGGYGKFTPEKLCVNDVPLWESAVLADFNGDRLPDLFSVSAENNQPVLFPGAAGGRFAEQARQCGSVKFEFPSAITAGDIDGDGDLDLWVTQYKQPYNDGQMPTPYYDANDGYPSYLLRNDGAGNFTDATEEAGLAAKRHRRTYSSSLVDLDEDGDLDLMVVSDFSGLDLYQNDGKGNFSDVTSQWVGPRHSFGMGHVLDDFNLDGRQDFYVIGMSSTTARRLDLMKLSRHDHPDIAAKRAEMGYGNRMYLGTAGGKFETPAFAASVARTGWSWGTTSFDFDLDGDRDLYVGNGHRSGKSTKDYCTRYWCHDVYTGSSQPDLGIKNLLATSIAPLNAGEISWNGYEKNAFLVNQGGKDFANVAFLFGTSFSYDAREVVSDDLDGDGRPDLLVAQMISRPGNKFESVIYGYRNTLETPNRWIGVHLQDGGPGLSPIGTKVAVHTSHGVRRRQLVTGDSYLAQHANTVHLGLGTDATVERIEVTWPNGKRSEIASPAIGRYHFMPHP